MIRYIVVGFLIVLVWLAAILIEFPYWIPTLVMLIGGLVLVLLWGRDKLRERRAARELEKALAAQAAQQAATARPDLQHEIAEMNAEFQKAVAALKTSKKGGKKALYALPWYAIIGPPGCGKSTALRNSGLQFPYLSASGGGVRGLGGTRNCDWWMTSEGVILDTAGRWTSEDEDRDEWLGFLDLIKKFRPKKPLNGIIAAVSVGDLGGAREEQVAMLARRVRERIDEVQGRLQLSLPVYVLFTKCDLLPGFIETFGAMSKEERSQIWGFTAPLTKPIGAPGEYFARGFETLMTVLERRSLKRLGEERKISSREMIHAFPQQVGIIEQNLQEFVHNLFLENVFNETPRLRGVYFTSGTQEGRPIDRLISTMAEAFGQPQVQLPAPQVEAKSYFLRDMFANVVFRDASVAVRSPDEVRRQRRNTYLAAAVIFGLAVAISGLPAISWANNRSFLNETRAAIDEANELIAGTSDEPVTPDELEPLRARLSVLQRNHQSTPVHLAMGLYQDDVYAPVRDLYLQVLERRVIAPMVRADVLEMEALGRRYETGVRPNPQEMRDSYNRLKLHLLLTVAKDESVAEPTQLDETLTTFATRELRDRWASSVGMTRSHPRYERLSQNVQYYLSGMGRSPELAFQRDDTAVSRVRGVFSAEGGFEVAIQGIIREAQVRSRGQDMNLARLLRRNVAGLTATESVRYAFTRDGWDRHVRNMLDNEAARFFGESWVLGHPPPEDARRAEIERACQVEALRSMFLNRYVDEWRRFIGSIQVAAPGTDQEAHGLLVQLTSGGDPFPFTQLFRAIDRELTLGDGTTAGRNVRTASTERALQNRLNKTLGGRMGEGAARRMTDAVGNDLRNRAGVGGLNCPPIPSEMTPQGVHAPFDGFLAFAVSPPADPQGGAQQVAPSARYEEQLGFLRNALQFRINGTNTLDYTDKRTAARTLLAEIVRDTPEEWRQRLQTLLSPPVEGAPEAAPPAPTPPPDPEPRRRRGRRW
jgi:type VI secretion system protein ImpL